MARIGTRDKMRPKCMVIVYLEGSLKPVACLCTGCIVSVVNVKRAHSHLHACLRCMFVKFVLLPSFIFRTADFQTGVDVMSALH